MMNILAAQIYFLKALCKYIHCTCIQWQSCWCRALIVNALKRFYVGICIRIWMVILTPITFDHSWAYLGVNGFKTFQEINLLLLQKSKMNKINTTEFNGAHPSLNPVRHDSLSGCVHAFHGHQTISILKLRRPVMDKNKECVWVMG